MSKLIEIEDLIETYRNKLILASKSEGTIETYMYCLNEFKKWYEDKNHKSLFDNIKYINESDIDAYLMYINSNGSATKIRKLTTLKMFFLFLKKRKIISVNPVEDVDSIKLERKIPVYFDLEQCRKLLENVDTQNTERDKLIIELFIYTGLRLSELVSLNVGDIKDKMIVTGKGKVERNIYINDYIKDKLMKYIEGKEANEPLFLSQRNKRMHKSSVQKMIIKAEKKAGLPFGVHTLRHTFATLMLDENASLYEIGKLLGHKSVSTTQIYAHVRSEKLNDLVNKIPKLTNN